ncbi:MAG TPA: hypothetical protein VM165_13795 [Planctomycetaceae bacterium]|nr:hypothetical protein [Planctomycetaceae bacterium]
MQQSEYMAMMQGNDGSLDNAELVAAYEQGITLRMIRLPVRDFTCPF